MSYAVRIAAFVVALSVCAWAQHGSGHASSGGSHAGAGHGGGFSGHGGMTAGRTSGGMRAGSSPGARSFARPSSLGQRGLSARGFQNRGRIRTYGFRNNCYGYACRFAYPGYAGFYDPYWLWGSDSSYDDSSYDPNSDQQTGLANQMNQQNFDQHSMRAGDDQDHNPNGYSRSAHSQPRQEERTAPAPPTVLVFRDQHTEEVHNYAIVGQTLWNFSSQRTEKIPLSALDVDATRKANDDRGVDFRLPGSGEGQ